jgi:hypothetical protein
MTIHSLVLAAANQDDPKSLLRGLAITFAVAVGAIAVIGGLLGKATKTFMLLGIALLGLAFAFMSQGAMVSLAQSIGDMVSYGVEHIRA